MQSIWEKYSEKMVLVASLWLGIVFLAALFWIEPEVKLGLVDATLHIGWRVGIKFGAVLTIVALAIVVFNTVLLKLLKQFAAFVADLWSNDQRRMELTLGMAALLIGSCETIFATIGAYDLGITGYWRPAFMFAWMTLIAGICLGGATIRVRQVREANPSVGWGRTFLAALPFMFAYFAFMAFFSVPFTMHFFHDIFLKDVQDVVLIDKLTLGSFTFSVTLKGLISKYFGAVFGFLSFFIVIFGPGLVGELKKPASKPGQAGGSKADPIKAGSKDPIPPYQRPDRKAA